MVHNLARRSILLAICLAWLLQSTRSSPVAFAALASSAPPAPALEGGGSCPGYWYVSYGGNTNWTLLNIDPFGYSAFPRHTTEPSVSAR